MARRTGYVSVSSNLTVVVHSNSSSTIDRLTKLSWKSSNDLNFFQRLVCGKEEKKRPWTKNQGRGSKRGKREGERVVLKRERGKTAKVSKYSWKPWKFGLEILLIIPKQRCCLEYGRFVENAFWLNVDHTNSFYYATLIKAWFFFYF